MISGFVLALREGLEAALVIGIALSVLRKMDRSDLVQPVWYGVAAAALLSLLAGFILNLLGTEFKGKGEQIFEGTAMLLAAGLLTWMVFWMRRQSRTMQSEIETSVRNAASDPGKQAMFALAFLGVGREGLELALYLFAAEANSGVIQAVSGALAGLACAVLFGWLLFSSTRRLSLKSFFQVTNVVLVLFAAGLVANGVSEYIEAGLIPAMIAHVWNTGSIVSDASTLGTLLKTLLGYSASPSLSQVFAYLAYFGLMLATFWISKAPAKVALKKAV